MNAAKSVPRQNSTTPGQGCERPPAWGEFCLEVFSQLGLDLFRRCRRTEAGDDLAVLSHEKFRKIPGDVLFAFFVGVALFEELVELTSAVSVDFDFGEHWKRNAKLGPNELKNFLVGAGFLAPKLVAGKSQNRESLGFIFFVQCTQTCVLGSEASFARDVDNQANLALVARKRDALARN